MTADGQSSTVLVPLTKLANGGQFRYFFGAMNKAADDSIAGTLLVHPVAEPHMGPTTKTEFNAAIAAGRLRVFSLEDQPETAQRLECLLRFLDRADGKELQLGGLTLARSDCRDLILKTAVLDNLEFYRELGGWHRQPARASASTSPPAPPPSRPAPEPVGSGARSTPAPGGAAATPQPAPASVPPAVNPAPVPQSIPSPASTPAPDHTAAASWAEGRLAELEKKLRLWALPVTPDGVEVGPTFVRLKVRPAGSRTTYKKVCDKAIDLKIHLGLEEMPLIGSQAGYISVDVQRPDRQAVSLATAVTDAPPELTGKPAFPVGLDVAGKTHWLNLAEPADCHLLVAGTTGSGKSQFLKAVLAALSRRLGPDQVQFVLIDPKRVTFNFGQQESPYLSAPVAYSVEDAQPLIERCLAETEQRYELMRQRGVEDVSQLKGTDSRPRVVVIIDEFADLMADKDAKKVLETTLKRIGAKARAAGIHLILATQRPEAPGVITTQLRSNLPGRVCLKVASDGDSKIMLGVTDAAHLLGKGDLLWMSGGSMVRLQSPLVSKEDLNADLRMS
jgi:S-DNA-T family DNA segregation ATPase FtsK/SpoIIIE